MWVQAEALSSSLPAQRQRPSSIPQASPAPNGGEGAPAPIPVTAEAPGISRGSGPIAAREQHNGCRHTGGIPRRATAGAPGRAGCAQEEGPAGRRRARGRQNQAGLNRAAGSAHGWLRREAAVAWNGGAT